MEEENCRSASLICLYKLKPNGNYKHSVSECDIPVSDWLIIQLVTSTYFPLVSRIADLMFTNL